MSSSERRLYMAVPFEDKDVAKSYGARWDKEHRKWWFPMELVEANPLLFIWMPGEAKQWALAHAFLDQVRGGYVLDPKTPLMRSIAGAALLSKIAILKAKRGTSVTTNKGVANG